MQALYLSNKNALATGRILMQILAWVLFAALPILFFPRPSFGTLPEQERAAYLFMFLSAIPVVAIFYLNFSYNFPTNYNRGKFLRFGLVLVGGVAVVLALTLFVANGFSQSGFSFPLPPNFLLRAMTYRCLVAIFLAFGFYSYSRWRKSEQEKVKAELGFLKAQINPHFLFNTLNSIYYLAIQQSPLTAEAVERLSSIMRYVLTEAKHDHVPLQSDLDYLSDYISLQRLRYPDNVHIDYKVEGEAAGQLIAPLLLISYVENAFKHGVSNERVSPISIHLRIQPGRVDFRVHNLKMAAYPGTADDSGIGLENTLQRLNLAYPRKHQLEIRDQAGSYEVQLHIQLT